MFSIHGLLRGENMEMGRDADTGGQIKYVVELGKALSKHNKVSQVDLFTRFVADKTVSEDYSKPIEQITDTFRIVRIQCGGKKYIRKELLWPHLDEFVDKTIKFIRQEKKTSRYCTRSLCRWGIRGGSAGGTIWYAFYIYRTLPWPGQKRKTVKRGA